MTNPFLPAQPAPQPQQPVYAPPAQPQSNPYAPPQPQGNPYATQQHPQYAQPAPQQPAYAPPVQQQTALVARPGQFSTPPPPSASGGVRPRLLDMYGRLLIVLPEAIQRGIPSRFMDKGQPQLQDKLTATVIVLDGGPLAFGGEPEKGPTGKGQHTHTEQVPYVVKGLWIPQAKLIEQLEEALAMRLRGEPGIALGRLWKVGQAQNDPWVLAAPQPDDVAQYDRYVSQVNPFTL